MSAPYFYAMTTPSKPFVVTRNKCIAPKQRAIERLLAVGIFRPTSPATILMAGTGTW
jgi:hypothetical protein